MLDMYYRNHENAICYRHSLSEQATSYDFHLHNGFEIYFFISGNVSYFVENKVYHLHYGDLLIINNLEIHRPSITPGKNYERVTIHFDPCIPRLFNTTEYDLLHSFVHRSKGKKNRLRLNVLQCDEIMTIFKQIQSLELNDDYENKLTKLLLFIQLLILINRVFQATHNEEEQSSIPKKLQPILDYIDQHLTEDLSLKQLEKTFYINGTYLSTLFKKSTGSRLGDYIRFKRISRAKKLIIDGYNVTEACMLSGFNDYSNFTRMFKRTVGVSPGKYKNQIKNNPNYINIFM